MFFTQKRWWLVALVVLALPGLGVAQPADGPRLPRMDPPAPPVYSRDGAVVVYAPQSKAGYRMPVLVFVNECREALERTVRLKLGAPSCPLMVMIGGKSDGDTRVLSTRLSRQEGGVRERIDLPDPEAADLGLFRRAVCAALLRAWMVEAGGTEATIRDLPVWLSDGVMRYAEREQRQTDMDRTLLLWSRARLPSAGELFAADSVVATREQAVAAVLAGWLMERRDGTSQFERLLRAAAAGTPWSPGQAALLVAGTEDMAVFDERVDARFLAEGRVVAQPGVTTAGIVRRFRSHLLLYPAFYDKTFGENGAWCSFQEAAMRADDVDMRVRAAAQSTRVKMAAVGRDGMLSAVAEAYAAFLDALAKGRKPGELTRLLLEAEGMRRALEERVGRGEVLRRQ